MSTTTDHSTTGVRASSAVVNLDGMLVVVFILFNFYFIIWNYDLAFSLSTGLDSFAPVFLTHWTRILWIAFPVEFIIGLGLVGHLWRTRTRDLARLSEREEMRCVVVEVQWLLLYGFAFYCGASFFTEKDVVWRASTSGATFFTPSHIIQLAISYPIYVLFALGSFFYAKTRLPYFAKGFSLAFLVATIGPFMMIPSASASDWGHRFWYIEEALVAPFQWCSVFFAWMVLGIFGIVLQLLLNIQRLVGSDAEELLELLAKGQSSHCAPGRADSGELANQGSVRHFEEFIEMDAATFIGLLASITEIIGFLQQNREAIVVRNIVSTFNRRAATAGTLEQKLHARSEDIEAVASIAVNIADTSGEFLERIRNRCLKPYREKISSDANETDLDEFRQVTKKCICANIRMARDDNGGRFPSDEFRDLWEKFGCTNMN
jgi:methane/ammonia monooxygenase subunit C